MKSVTRFLTLGVFLVLTGILPAAGKAEPRALERFLENRQRQLGQGFQGRELMRAQSNNNQYLVVIWGTSKNSFGAPEYLLEVFRSSGNRFRKIGGYADVYLTLDPQLTGADINGNGLTDIVVHTFTGGNCWGCSYVKAFEIDHGRLQEIPTGYLGEDFVPSEFKDVDGDGIYELIGLDMRWEFTCELSHADSPAIVKVFSWEGDRYRYVPKKFRSFYELAVQELEGRLVEYSQKLAEDRERGDSRDNGEWLANIILADAVRLSFTYAELGDAQYGFDRFLAVTPGLPEPTITNRACLIQKMQKLLNIH